MTEEPPDSLSVLEENLQVGARVGGCWANLKETQSRRG